MSLWILLLFTRPVQVEASPPSSATAPNVVWIVADDLGLQLGCYQDPDARTPAIDDLAKHGIVFDHAYAAVASCSPSRSSLLTGRFSHATGQYGLQHGVHRFEGRAQERSVSAMLAARGYRTLRIGKLHVGPIEAFPFDQTLSASSRNPVAMADAVAQALTDPDPRPFFLYFCPSDPHRGGGVATEIPLHPDRFGNPAPGNTHLGVREQSFRAAEVHPPRWLPQTAACREEWAQYLQSVARFDQGVGRLLAHLEHSGLRDNTLVVLTSDHGPPFPGAKTTLYRPGLQVPLVIAGPGVAVGERRQELVSLVDLVPTLDALLDLRSDSDPPLHGHSLLNLLAAPDPQWKRELHASHTFHEVTMYYPMRMLRRGRYELIVNFASPLPFPFASDLYGSATWQDVLHNHRTQFGVRTVQRLLHRPRLELYDLRNDPWETNNLAADDSARTVLLEMIRAMKAWQRETKDPWLLKWERE